MNINGKEEEAGLLREEEKEELKADGRSSSSSSVWAEEVLPVDSSFDISREQHNITSNDNDDKSFGTPDRQVGDNKIPRSRTFDTTDNSVSDVDAASHSGKAVPNPNDKMVDEFDEEDRSKKRRGLGGYVYCCLCLVLIVVILIIILAATRSGPFRQTTSQRSGVTSSSNQQQGGIADDGSNTATTSNPSAIAAPSTPNISPIASSPVASPSGQVEPTVPPATIQDGEMCFSDAECSSGACGTVFADSGIGVLTSKSCCASGQVYTASGSIRGAEYDYCSMLQINDACGYFDELCDTSQNPNIKCVDGLCKDSNSQQVSSENLDDIMDDSCASNSDCPDGRTCGWTRVVSSLGNAMEFPRTCCPDGETFFDVGEILGVTTPYCTNQPDGTDCGELDEICASGHCVNNVCGSPQGSGESCTENEDCLNGACGYEDNGSLFSLPNKICCESGEVHLEIGAVLGIEHYFCTDLAEGTECGSLEICAEGLSCIAGTCSTLKTTGESCNEHDDCQNNVCGYNDFPTFGDVLQQAKVCCSSNWTHVETGPVLGVEHHFCTDMPEGTSCGTVDELCAEGLSCIGGACKTPSAVGETCDDHSDCQNSKCGFTSLPSGIIDWLQASKYCCDDGSDIHMEASGILGIEHPFCTNQGKGTPCGGVDAICAAGEGLECIGNTCQDPSEPTNNCDTDADCGDDGACGYTSFGLLDRGEKVCCDSGEVHVHVGAVLGAETPYCTQMPVDTRCGMVNEMCADGLSCVGGGGLAGTCQSLKADDESCSDNADCASGACGKQTWPAILQGRSCCTTGTQIHVEAGMFGIQHYYCKDFPAGTNCGNLNELCASGQCNGGRCT